MDRLVSFLLFAALFYFMMRFGCGAHVIHGHHGHRREGSGTDAKDPVCGMQVAADAGYSEIVSEPGISLLLAQVPGRIRLESPALGRGITRL